MPMCRERMLVNCVKQDIHIIGCRARECVVHVESRFVQMRRPIWPRVKHACSAVPVDHKGYQMVRRASLQLFCETAFPIGRISGQFSPLPGVILFGMVPPLLLILFGRVPFAVLMVAVWGARRTILTHSGLPEVIFEYSMSTF